MPSRGPPTARRTARPPSPRRRRGATPSPRPRPMTLMEAMRHEVATRRDHPPGGVGEVLRGTRAEHLHVPRRPPREQDRDQGGGPGDLERAGHLGEHAPAPGQGQAPRLHGGQARRPEARDRHARPRRFDRDLRGREVTMAVRKYKPTTPGRRGASVSSFDELTRGTPETWLVAQGRNK